MVGGEQRLSISHLTERAMQLQQILFFSLSQISKGWRYKGRFHHYKGNSWVKDLQRHCRLYLEFFFFSFSRSFFLQVKRLEQINCRYLTFLLLKSPTKPLICGVQNFERGCVTQRNMCKRHDRKLRDIQLSAWKLVIRMHYLASLVWWLNKTTLLCGSCILNFSLD